LQWCNSSFVMDFDEQLEVDHFVLTERKCRVCGKTKDLIDGFYLIRKNKSIQSSYSYECKSCTIQRVKRKKKVEIKSGNTLIGSSCTVSPMKKGILINNFRKIS